MRNSVKSLKTLAHKTGQKLRHASSGSPRALRFRKNPFYLVAPSRLATAAGTIIAGFFQKMQFVRGVMP